VHRRAHRGAARGDGRRQRFHRPDPARVRAAAVRDAAGLAPLVVVLALLLAYLPDVLRGQLRAIRLLRLFGSAWFAVGPALVLSIFPAASPDEAQPLVLLLALAAQLAADFGASALIERLLRAATLREQLRESWVYAVDVRPDARRSAHRQSDR
jgi:hypothetical protein